MPLFERSGVEDELAMCCVALRFTIETLEDREDGQHAAGTFTGKDYIEHGITFTSRWLATRSNEDVRWTTVRDPDDDPFFRNRETGEVLFTGNNAVNESIKQHIARWLGLHLEGVQSSTGPEEYTGTMHTHDGECVCVQLMVSSPHRPFPWEETTGGGQYPQRCFRCSCGARWYCVSPENHVWAMVADPEAWEQLLKHNGVPTQKITCGHGAFVVLQQTMVDHGFIPLP